MFSIYVTALFLNTFLSLLVASIAFSARDRPGGLPLGYLMVAIAEWSLSLGFEALASTIPVKVFWSKVEYIGIISSPVLLFNFALAFSQRERWLQQRHRYLYWVIPLITLGLAFTNEQHQLIWTNFTPITPTVPGMPFQILYGHGPWFWLMMGYFYLLIAAASFLILQAALRYRHIYRRQAILLFISLIPPWIFNILYVFELGPLAGLDLTPVSFSVTGVLLTMSFIRLQLLDLVPVARDKVIETMRDGVVVLDAQRRIVDINPAAQALVGLKGHSLIGMPVGDVFKRWAELGTHFRDVLEAEDEVYVDGIGYMEVYVYPLYERDGRLAGRIVISHNIDNRKQAQLQLEQAHNELEQRVAERTAQLADANEQLREEVKRRQKAEAEVQALNAVLEQRVADRTRELSTLYALSAVANKTLDLETLCSEMLIQTIGAMHSDAGAIFLLEEPTPLGPPYTSPFQLVACEGLSPETWKQHDSFLAAQKLLDRLCLPPELILVPDMATDPDASALWALNQPGTLLTAPLQAGGRILGLLVQLRWSEETFEQEEINLLASIASQMSIVVESGRLRQMTLESNLVQERERLSRDLHDTVTQSLYGLVTLSELGKAQLEAELTAAIPETLAQIGETARHALKEMRLFIHQLRPPNLETEGLLSALHQRLSAVEGRVGLQTRLLADETISLTIEQQNDLYYIVQEALNNILRHAQARSITVYLGREGEQVVLEVLDDGCGFEPDQVARGGMGLPNIRQRAANLGGTLKISSIPNQGTRIRVVLEGKNES